jgi:hypothetical protein
MCCRAIRDFCLYYTGVCVFVIWSRIETVKLIIRRTKIQASFTKNWDIDKKISGRVHKQGNQDWQDALEADTTGSAVWCKSDTGSGDVIKNNMSGSNY